MGVENIRVDTIQGVLAYKRPGPDGRVQFSPPSALRRIDLFLVDEASQYGDQEWQDFFFFEYSGAASLTVRGGRGRLSAVAAAGRWGSLSGVLQETRDSEILFRPRTCM